MYLLTFLNAVGCAVLIASSCNAETNMQIGVVSQSYSNITTKSGVMDYMEQALDVNNTEEPIHKAIYIEHLTGKNDLAASNNKSLQDLLQNTLLNKPKTVTLDDVALYLDNKNVSITFKVHDKANTAVNIEYSLNDTTTNSFQNGLSKLKILSQHEFAAAQRSATKFKKKATHKFRNQWQRFKGKMNDYFKKAKKSFNHLVHKDCSSTA